MSKAANHIEIDCQRAEVLAVLLSQGVERIREARRRLGATPADLAEVVQDHLEDAVATIAVIPRQQVLIYAKPRQLAPDDFQPIVRQAMGILFNSEG